MFRLKSKPSSGVLISLLRAQQDSLTQYKEYFFLSSDKSVPQKVSVRPSYFQTQLAEVSAGVTGYLKIVITQYQYHHWFTHT
jgi:hypothetical protein